jgi:murein endopeptidase
MAERPHPVRKRTGLTELNALLLPLFLLAPVLLALSVQAAIVATAPTEVETEELAPLRIPDRLAFERTRRVAAAAADVVLDRSRAGFEGHTAAQHVHALARHLGLRDRPAAPPIIELLGPRESLTLLARRWRMQPADLLFFNPDLDPDALQPGQPIRVWAYRSDGYSRSIGPTARGRLEVAEPMPEGRGWIVRNRANSWAARQTVDALVEAMRVTMAEHPRGQDLMIADISHLGGGRMTSHRSHQSGRDVDLTYFRRSRELPVFSATQARELDLARTWTFVRTLVTRHDVEYIFMSVAIQRALYDYASRRGEHPAFLAQLFGVNGNGSRAIVRFAPGHTDHMHIRFGCAPSDVRCGS